MTSGNSTGKKRKPLLAALLSLASTGLGQVYNGELVKGVLLGSVLCLAALVYALRLYADGSRDRLYFCAFMALFATLEVYSIVQAYLRSQRLGSSYSLKRSNRLWVYLALAILFLCLFFLPGQLIRQHVLTDMSAWHPFRSAKAKAEYIGLYDERAKAWPVPSEARLVDTSYGQTYVRISGPIDAPPLVLLHGAGATSLMWAANVKDLSAAYRTYAIDNIYDLGRSVFTRKIEAPADLVKWLNEVFNTLELGDRINLVGQSYGGWIAGLYLLRYPGRLDKVVLLAPAMTILPFRLEFLERGLFGSLPIRWFGRSMMFWLLKDLARKDEAGRKLVEEYADHLHLGRMFFKPKSLVRPTLLSDEDWSSIKVPTLVLIGEHEKIYSGWKALKRLKRVAPQIRAEIVPGAGHDLTIVQAEMVDRMILEFLGVLRRP
jgi:pimeloyl-ACP methyl ester carboxylesterase